MKASPGTGLRAFFGEDLPCFSSAMVAILSSIIISVLFLMLRMKYWIIFTDFGGLFLGIVTWQQI